MLFIPQKMHDECGLACLLMLLLHQGYVFDYPTLQAVGKFSSYYEINHFLCTYHITHTMYYCDEITNIIFPSIGVLYFKRRKHFIVIWKSVNQQIYYSDPAKLYIKKKKVSSFKKYVSNEYINISKVSVLPYLKDGFHIPYSFKFFLFLLFLCFILYKILNIFGII